MSETTEHGEHRGQQPGGLALAITIAALLLLVIFQTVGVVRDHLVLVQERAAQQPAVAQGRRLRRQLQTLAEKTAELARSGDQGARNVLDYMHRNGVTIPPQRATPAK